MLATNILDAEVVHNKRERDWSSFVMPERGGVADRLVSVRGEVLDEAFFGDAARLLQSWHALSNLHVHITVVYKGCEVVGVNDLLGDFVEFDFHILETVHGRSVVKV